MLWQLFFQERTPYPFGSKIGGSQNQAGLLEQGLINLLLLLAFEPWIVSPNTNIPREEKETVFDVKTGVSSL